MVVDENEGRLLGEVTGIRGAHGTAIALSSGHGFATSGNDQSIVMFDLKTFKELARMFSLNGDAHSSTSSMPRRERSSRTSRSAASPSTGRRPA